MDRPPRVRPAVVAGAGAGGSLAAAALCIIALGAASVSYGPWRSRDGGEHREKATLRLTSPERPPAHPRLLEELHPPVVLRGRPVADPRDPTAAPPRSDRRRRERPRRRPAPAPAEPPPAAPPAAEPPAAEPSPPPPPTLLRDHVTGAAGQARALGKEVAAAASRVSPEAGALVEETSGTVATMVEDVALLLP